MLGIYRHLATMLCWKHFFFYSMKNIEQLRIFFRITNAAFDFKKKVHAAIGVLESSSEMQELHRVALVEVEKENPDEAVILELLAEMESLALLQARHPPPPKKFKAGGFFNKKVENPADLDDF